MTKGREGGRTLKSGLKTTDEGAKGEMGKTNLRRRRRRTRVSVVFCRTQAAHSHSYVQEDEEQEEEFGDRRSERRGNKYARSEEGSVVRASTVEEVERASQWSRSSSLIPRFVVRSGVEN